MELKNKAQMRTEQSGGASMLRKIHDMPDLTQLDDATIQDVTGEVKSVESDYKQDHKISQQEDKPSAPGRASSVTVNDERKSVATTGPTD